MWTCQRKSNYWQLAWLARNKFCDRFAQQIVYISRVIQPCDLNIFYRRNRAFSTIERVQKAAWKCGWFILLQTLSNQALLLVAPHGFCHRHLAPPSAPHGRLRTSQASSGDIDVIRPDLRAFSPIGGMSLLATAHQIAVLRPILSLPQVLPSGYECHPSVLSNNWLLWAFLG